MCFGAYRFVAMDMYLDVLSPLLWRDAGLDDGWLAENGGSWLVQIAVAVVYCSVDA